MLGVRFEEMKEDQEKILRKIATFIGYNLSEEQIKVRNTINTLVTFPFSETE